MCAARLFTTTIALAALATGCAGSPPQKTRVDTHPIGRDATHLVSQVSSVLARDNLPTQYVCPESAGPPLFGEAEQTQFAVCLVGNFVPHFDKHVAGFPLLGKHVVGFVLDTATTSTTISPNDIRVAAYVLDTAPDASEWTAAWQSTYPAPDFLLFKDRNVVIAAKPAFASRAKRAASDLAANRPLRLYSNAQVRRAFAGHGLSLENPGLGSDTEALFRRLGLSGAYFVYVAKGSKVLVTVAPTLAEAQSFFQRLQGNPNKVHVVVGNQPDITPITRMRNLVVFTTGDLSGRDQRATTAALSDLLKSP